VRLLGLLRLGSLAEALQLGLLLALLLLGELHLVLEHADLIAQLLGHLIQVYRLDLGLNILGHVIDAEAAMVELSSSIGLVLLLHILEGTGNGLGDRMDVVALGHEATIVGGVVHAIQLAIISSVLIEALGVGSSSVMKFGLFLAVDSVLSQVTGLVKYIYLNVRRLCEN